MGGLGGVNAIARSIGGSQRRRHQYPDTVVCCGTLYLFGRDLEEPYVLLWDLEFRWNKFIKLKGINTAGSRPCMRVIATLLARTLGEKGGGN